MIGTLLMSVPFGIALGLAEQFGPAFVFAAGACGFFLNGSWIPLTIRGQESVPTIAMMSGLTIGLRGIAVTPIGLIAESVGLTSVVLATACLPIPGAILMRFVPPLGREPGWDAADLLNDAVYSASRS